MPTFMQAAKFKPKNKSSGQIKKAKKKVAKKKVKTSKKKIRTDVKHFSRYPQGRDPRETYSDFTESEQDTEDDSEEDEKYEDKEDGKTL